MFEDMKWEDVYQLWRAGSYHFPKMLTEPISAETVFVEYNGNSCFYGYDWLEAGRVAERKQLIAEKTAQFLYFTKPSNKGTIQTAEMLVEAQTEEELAAIWIAATAKELERWREGHVGWYASRFYLAACEFLEDRFYLWHHAMRKLVPGIMIPSSILMNITCENAKPVMGLIQMNTVMLKGAWRILRYSSLKEGEAPEGFGCRTHP